MDHAKLVTEKPEKSVQYDDDLEIGCCCRFSVVAFASIMTIICGVVSLIAAISFAPFPMDLGIRIVLPVSIIGFVCGVSFMVGGIYLLTRPRTKYQNLPRRDARKRLFCAWALFSVYVVLDIALFTGSAISFKNGVINSCDSCGISILLFSVSFTFLLYCLVCSVIAVILGVKLGKYHVENGDEEPNSQEFASFNV